MPLGGILYGSLGVWRNLWFDGDENLDLNFDHGCRKNSKFRQGTTVMVSANPHGEVCFVRLLRELENMKNRKWENTNVVEHPPRLTRGLMLSYGACMELGLHGHCKNATWKETGLPSCP